MIIIDESELTNTIKAAEAYWDAVAALREIGQGPLSTTLGWCIRARTLIPNTEERNAINIAKDWPKP